jgi:thioredoxin-dependent peroxiredoxin
MRSRSLLAMLMSLLIPLAVWSQEPPQVGTRAPDFVLNDADGVQHRLSDWHGHWLVLYFYPRDNTPGCTLEAANFRDDRTAFEALNAQVVGISVDDSASHRAFAEQQQINFPLLVDPGGEIARRYGALTNLGFLKVAKRRTFLIDPDGLVAKTYLSVDAATHAKEVAADIRNLRGT